jgi:hypothetical protein
MPTIERCVDEISKVRDVATGEHAAYLARSRIDRMILSCLQVVASETGLRPPVFPEPLTVPENGTPWAREVASACNRIMEVTKILCQPSEPLDERWRRGWAELLRELGVLEELLRTRNVRASP